jgi:hypothetical protein
MKTNRTANLHMRVDVEFKSQIEAAAAKLDIPPSAWMRMALREYIAKHDTDRLRETGPSYGNPPPPTPPDKKLRCAIASAAVSTSYFVVTRKG